MTLSKKFVEKNSDVEGLFHGSKCEER